MSEEETMEEEVIEEALGGVEESSASETITSKATGKALPKLHKSVIDSVMMHHHSTVISGDYGMFWCDLEFCHPDKSRGTAFWLFNGKCHLIRISECVQDIVSVKGAKNIPLFVKRIYDHEKAHGLYTSWKMKALHAYIEGLDIPHTLWNILEDCRIEYRLATEKKMKWGWDRWLLQHDDESDDGLPHPAAVLLNFKMIERRSLMLDDYLDKFAGDPAAEKRVKEVHDFYKRVTTKMKVMKRQASFDVADIAQNMCEKWPFLLKEDIPTGGMVEDMKRIREESGGGEGMSGEMEEGSDWEDDTIIDATRKATAILDDGSSTVTKTGRTKFLKNYPSNTWAPGCGDGVAGILRDCLHGGESSTMATTDPTEDIDTEEFMSKAPDFYREKEKSKTEKRAKIVVIYDCSGSMGGGHHEEGIKMLDGLMTLHKKRECELIIWFTGEGGQLRIEGGIANQYLENIEANCGCESYGMCMDAAEEDMLAATADGGCVLCWTDAGITDEDKPRSSDFKTQGIEPIGCYVGGVDAMPNIMKYFPRGACRDNIEDLAVAVADLIKE